MNDRGEALQAALARSRASSSAPRLDEPTFLGLRDVIVRVADGYFIDPKVPVVARDE